MLQLTPRLVLVALLALSAACETLAMETQPVYLASELDVGLGILQGCGSILHEADALCSGRKPFSLHPAPSSDCTSYYLCVPGRGACLQTCPTGTVFNTACNCCQDSATASIDLATCSSSTATRPQRRLLSTDASSAQPPAAQALLEPSQQQQQQSTAAGGDATIVFTAATRTATDLSTGQQLLANKPVGGAATFGSWNSHGKRYSTGPFAGSNAVKEPAFGSSSSAITNRQPQLPTTAPIKPTAAAGTGSTSSSSSSTVTNEIGSRPASAVGAKHLPVFAEDDSASSSSRRSLLATAASAGAQTTAAADAAAASRQLSMKRIDPSKRQAANKPAASKAGVAVAAAPEGGAAAATVVTAATPQVTVVSRARPAREHSRVARSRSSSSSSIRPTAARALGPDDEAQVPFATTAAASAAAAPVLRGHPARRVRAVVGGHTPATTTSTTTTTASDSKQQPASSHTAASGGVGQNVLDMGKLEGPEAEDALAEMKQPPHGDVKGNVVPLPSYMYGEDAPYHYEPRSRHYYSGSSTHDSHHHSSSSSGSPRRGHRSHSTQPSIRHYYSHQHHSSSSSPRSSRYSRDSSSYDSEESYVGYEGSRGQDVAVAVAGAAAVVPAKLAAPTQQLEAVPSRSSSTAKPSLRLQ